ncbi:MAG: hypothetical protein J2P32_05055, partial [Actinobacteria bacterium]|nr:hypothetical protein [Actinomycetota bacterium]
MVLPSAVTEGRAAPAAHTKARTAHAAGNGQLAAASAAKATASPASHPKGHYNVGKTHSPKLLQQLAGPSGTSGPVISSPLAAATAGPVNGAAQGVDVASFQHPNGASITWSAVAKAGIKFAAVKVTEGAYYTNPYAASDLAAAKAAGLTTIGYAFAIPNGGFDSNGNQLPAGSQAQADYLLASLPSGVPVMLDIEYDPYAGTGPNGDGTSGSCYGLSTNDMKDWISGFDAEIQAKTGWLPIIYTTQDWWSTCTGGSTAFGQNPAWPADYSNSSPALPAGWGTWNLWQYTSKGTVSGIQSAGGTDLDQANPALITLLNGGLEQVAPNRSANAGSTIGRQFKTSDSSGQAPAFTATGLPPGLSIGG